MSFRRLLKNRQTGLYYTGKDGWTPNPSEAFAFHNTIEAIREALRLGERDLDLVMKFKDSRLDVFTPIGGLPPSPSRKWTKILAICLTRFALG